MHRDCCFRDARHARERWKACGPEGLLPGGAKLWHPSPASRAKCAPGGLFTGKGSHTNSIKSTSFLDMSGIKGIIHINSYQYAPAHSRPPHPKR